MADNKEKLDHLHGMIKGIRTAMLTTFHNDELRSRPMAPLQEEGKGETIWFMTSKKSDKAWEIGDNSRVNVTYCDPGSNTYVSINGTASLVDDTAKTKELWTPIAKAWFDGPEDPDIILVRVNMEGAEYWDGPSNKMVAIFAMVASAIAGHEVGWGSNETVEA